MRTPHPVFCSLPIPQKKSTISSIESLIFTKGNGHCAQDSHLHPVVDRLVPSIAPPPFRLLLLCSSKTVTKETAQMAPCFGWASPNPWFGSSIELCCGHAHRLLALIGIGTTLSSERITAEEAPPAFLQIEQSRAPLGMNTCWMRGWSTSQVRVSRLLWLLRLSVIRKRFPSGLSASMSLSSSM